MLYIVPTPIGNLEDMSPRVKRILAEADMVLAEDTRTTGQLLKLSGIQTRLKPYHQHNEHAVAGELATQMLTQNIALVSDAGMPGISDPAFLLVRAAIAQGVEIVALPGPSALLPALVASGLPCDRFCFEGFLPVKKGRATRLESLKAETRTMVFYESPHRLLRTLRDFAIAFGDERPACVSREISKKFEEHKRGTMKELLDFYTLKPAKGEIVICVGGAEK